MFVFSPALLMGGRVHEIIWVTFTALVGVALLSCATIGWWLANMSKWERFLLLCAAVLLIEPRLITDIAAAIFIVPVLLNQIRARRKVDKDEVTAGQA
jgi:TRAP-type uncharacterized transport system fused permease subunit